MPAVNESAVKVKKDPLQKGRADHIARAPSVGHHDQRDLFPRLPQLARGFIGDESRDT